jgi:RecA-family ATPase
VRPFPKQQAAQEPQPLPEGESAFALLERNIPEPVRLCDPWAIEGINIVAGRPKLGKTTLERQKLAASAIGGDFLDSKFDHPAKCAFLSLEEGELLCRAKFKMAGFPDEALSSIQLFFEWPRGAAGVDLLDRYLQANREVRLICIDSLTRFRVVPDVRVPAFMADYEAVNALHDMSKKHPGVCIDVIHHTRKAKSDDPIDDISGTYGLTAAADSYLVMRHHADGAVMHVGGRLWERNESQFSLRRAAALQRWEMVGVHLDITDKQREALDYVKTSPSGMSGKELADKLNITVPSAWQRLDELLEHGFVTKKYGRVHAKN